MTQENENKQRRVDDKRADVPLQWSEATPAPAATDTAAKVKPAQREVPEFTGLDTIARVFAEAANGDGKVVLSAQSCDLLYRAMTTPIVAPAVQAQAELTDERIEQVLNRAGISKNEPYVYSAVRAIEREVRSAAGSASPVAADYVLMPKRLTAENGAKGALSGEFKESIEVTCHACGGSGDDDESDNDAECPECKGDGILTQDVPMSWDTIKDVYKRAVELLAAPSSNDVRNAATWQPIATAPKDTPIIGHWNGYKRPCVMWWNHVDKAWESWADRNEQPSLWMLLPEAPAASKEGDTSNG